MKINTKISPPIFFTLFLFGHLAAAPNSKQGAGEKEHLFPGTGFFVKNRDPYDEKIAKKWFLEAHKSQKEGDSGEALSIYEKFTKRRSDASINTKQGIVLVGPESLYRAALIREQKGDWQKSFQYLRLIAQAYTNYDFERIAESLMRLAEKRICPENGECCPVFVLVVRIACGLIKLPNLLVVQGLLPER